MARTSSVQDITPEILPQETTLFAAAARHPEEKDFILKELENFEPTPAAMRITLLILGENPPDAKPSEKLMAWQFAQMIPAERRRLKQPYEIRDLEQELDPT